MHVSLCCYLSQIQRKSISSSFYSFLTPPLRWHFNKNIGLAGAMRYRLGLPSETVNQAGVVRKGIALLESLSSPVQRLHRDLISLLKMRTRLDCFSVGHLRVDTCLYHV